MKTGVKYSVIWLFSLFFYTEASFRCDYKYSVEAKGWFKHMVIPVTWSEARLHCQLQGATLASPLNLDITAEMKHIMSSYFTADSEVYTGFHASFAGGYFHSIEGVPLNTVPVVWAENEPNNLNNNEQCITFNGNGELADRSCHEILAYICYRSIDKEVMANECGSVDPEYTLDRRTGSCYKFHTVPRTFDRAQFVCSAEGGYLAIINSAIESKVLKELFARYPPKKMVGHFWKNVAFIGFFDWDKTGNWRTIHGQTLTEAGFDTFAPGEPNNAKPGEYCGSIYRNGLLNDLWCDRPAAFICEKDPNFPPVCHALN